MAIRGILFDNDGTLVDTYDLILDSMRHATRQVLGKVLSDERLMQGVGTPLEAQFAAFTDDAGQQADLARVYRDHNHARHDQNIQLFPGVANGLRRLRDAGVALGVVTAKRHALAWHGLEITGAAPYLACLVGPEDCEVSKPDPAPVLKGVELLGLRPSECLYVGDSPFDMQAGNAAGCPTVAVLWGMFGEDALRAEGPTYVIRDFAELDSLCAGPQGEDGTAR